MMEWFISTEPFYDGYPVFIRDEGTKRIVKPIQYELEETKLEVISPNPAFVLSQKEAQRIMNELWKAGIRPHNGEGTNSHTEAIKYHLEDMRRLVFPSKD